MDAILSLQKINDVKVGDYGCYLDGENVKTGDLVKYLVGAIQSQQKEIERLRRIWEKQ